jgi:hypothetical protein
VENEALKEQSHRDRKTIRDLASCVEKLQAVLQSRSSPLKCDACLAHREEIRRLRDENNRLSKENEERTDRLNALEDSVKYAQRRFEDELTVLRTENRQLLQLNNELKVDEERADLVLKVKEKMLADQLADINELKQRLASNEQDIVALEQQLEESAQNLMALENKILQKTENEERLRFLVSEFQGDEELAGEACDILRGVDVANSVDLSACFEDLKGRIEASKKAHKEESKSLAAIKDYAGCGKKMCRARISQLLDLTEQVKSVSQKEIMEKECELSLLTDSLVQPPIKFYLSLT